MLKQPESKAKPTRRARVEDAIQRTIVQHYRIRAAPGVFMFSVPNGGYRRSIEAAIMKGTGTVPSSIFIRAVWLREALGSEMITRLGLFTRFSVTSVWRSKSSTSLDCLGPLAPRRSMTVTGAREAGVPFTRDFFDGVETLG